MNYELDEPVDGDEMMDFLKNNKELTDDVACQLEERVYGDVTKLYHHYMDMDTDDDMDKLAKEFEGMIKEDFKKEYGMSRDMLRKIDVEGVWEKELGAVSFVFNISYGDEDVTFEPSGMYYNEDTQGEHYFMDRSEDDPRVKWLGDEDSPYFDQNWKDEYIRANTYEWFKEAAEYQSFELEEALGEIGIDVGP